MTVSEVKFTFTAEILKAPGSTGGAFIQIPSEVVQGFGKKGRIKVQATFDGQFYQGSIAPMGGRHILGVLKDIRHKIGKSPGDIVEVSLVEDTAPREIILPNELTEAFHNHPLEKAFFETLSYTNKKEYVRWIKSAKRELTHKNRLTRTLDMLSKGAKNPFSN